MALMTYLEGIRSALHEEMRRDERVFCLGEDIGVYGGAFKATKGLLEEFGPLRVLDTPLSESAIVGVATGAALMGMRPVAEMQFSDFITCAFNQVVNMSAKIHYRWGARVPMVIRCPSGGGVHGGPFHSQNPESWFFHVPGLKIVTPATAADAKGLLTAAIRDNNPVMYFEHKFLYRRIKDEVPEGDHVVPIGVAACRRPGKHMSVITYGSMVHVCLEAAEKLQAEGCEAEIIDLRSLLPYDKAAVLESVQRTGKALIVHEDTLTGGVGAEFAAIIAEEAFENLDGPVRRVASIDTPVPYSPPLEEFFMPNVDKVLAAMQDLAAY